MAPGANQAAEKSAKVKKGTRMRPPSLSLRYVLSYYQYPHIAKLILIFYYQFRSVGLLSDEDGNGKGRRRLRRAGSTYACNTSSPTATDLRHASAEPEGEVVMHPDNDTQSSPLRDNEGSHFHVQSYLCLTLMICSSPQ